LKKKKKIHPAPWGEGGRPELPEGGRISERRTEGNELHHPILNRKKGGKRGGKKRPCSISKNSSNTPLGKKKQEEGKKSHAVLVHERKKGGGVFIKKIGANF